MMVLRFEFSGTNECHYGINTLFIVVMVDDEGEKSMENPLQPLLRPDTAFVVLIAVVVVVAVSFFYIFFR